MIEKRLRGKGPDRSRSMSEQRKRAAIEAVARHVSAAWTASGDNTYITIGGKPISVEIAIAEQRSADRTDPARPRLRFDKVARRLTGHLRDTLHAAVPEGRAALVTVTAPIRLAVKTAVALEAIVRDCLMRGSGQAECQACINGNQVRVRVVQSSARLGSKVIGFVHNPRADSDRLLDMAQLLLRHIGEATERRRPARSASERWLVVAIGGGVVQLAAYRQLYDQLAIASDFARILLVSGEGHVETLVE